MVGTQDEFTGSTSGKNALYQIQNDLKDDIFPIRVEVEAARGGEVDLNTRINTAEASVGANQVLTAADVVSTNADVVSTNADAAATALDKTATNADVVSTNADVVLTAADVVLTTADATATALDKTATNADVVSTNADVVTTNADVVTTNADVVTTTALVDNFDDRYLGAKASDPALDNDGDALVDGALYFNTTIDVMKVYDLGTTTWLQMTPTSGEQTNIDTVSGIAANVTTVAGIAANVTTVAGISANVTTAAGISANITTVAGISTDVTTAATNVVDITNFADVYQGPKASDPATRNDSSALQAGDLYFNTTSDLMKFYTGASWSSIAPGIGAVSDDPTPQLGGDLDLNGFTILNLPGVVDFDGGASTTVYSSADIILESGGSI